MLIDQELEDMALLNWCQKSQDQREHHKHDL